MMGCKHGVRGGNPKCHFDRGMQHSQTRTRTRRSRLYRVGGVIDSIWQRPVNQVSIPGNQWCDYDSLTVSASPSWTSFTILVSCDFGEIFF